MANMQMMVEEIAEEQVQEIAEQFIQEGEAEQEGAVQKAGNAVSAADGKVRDTDYSIQCAIQCAMCNSMCNSFNVQYHV